MLTRLAIVSQVTLLLVGYGLAQGRSVIGGSLAEAKAGLPVSFRQIEELTQKVPGGKTETRESRIYRDSQGRIRIETANHIQIYDTTAGVLIDLEPSAKAARRIQFPKPGLGPPVAGVFGLPGPAPSEPKFDVLGPQAIEGIMFLGIRITQAGTTPDANVTSVRWIAPEMGLTASIQNSSSEWEYSARIENVDRKEPDPQLFTIPEQYKVQEETARPPKP